MLDRDLTRAEAMLFKALSDETRLALLEALVNRERNVSDLVEAVAKEQSAVSHHLRCLRNCGLVRTRKSGKEIYYALNGEGRVQQLLSIARTHVSETLKSIIACDVVAETAPRLIRPAVEDV